MCYLSFNLMFCASLVFWKIMDVDRGHGSVVECRTYNPNTGFDPLVGKDEGQVFCLPPSQLLCWLVCAWPPFVCTACTQVCMHVKDHMAICHKRVGLTASGMVTQKCCMHKTVGELKKSHTQVSPLMGVQCTFYGETQNKNTTCNTIHEKIEQLFIINKI